MRPSFLNTCLVSLYFLIASAASATTRVRYSDQFLPEVVTSFSADLSKEPSCDELRAMWRISKKQSRVAESTNEIPTYRDPFAYNVWEDHASIKSGVGGKMRRPLIYGRLIHNTHRPRIQENTPERIRAFEKVARVFGTSVPIPEAHSSLKQTTQMHFNKAQTGSFQHLKELIISERARELHEKKISKENAARESALQYQRMIQNQNITDNFNFTTDRSRGQLEGDINFPDVHAFQVQ